MTKVSVENMATAITEEMERYQKAVASDVKDTVREVGKEAVKELKRTSPKDTGEYAKGWKTTVQSENANSIDIVIHDKKYQITHLLERGHQNRGGGRTPAIVHIAPVEKQKAEKLERELIKLL